jgi:hypothetical protein
VAGRGHHPPDDDAAPRELLGPLLEDWRDVYLKEVLERLEPTDFALPALVGQPWLAVVVAPEAPRAAMGRGAVKLKFADFVRSVETLARAKLNPRWPGWKIHTTGVIARGRRLEVLQWARVHGCPWDETTCA